MRMTLDTIEDIGDVHHEIDMEGDKGFGSHTFFRAEMQQWWWVVGTNTEHIIATGPAPSEKEAKRRAAHFMGATKVMFGDA